MDTSGVYPGSSSAHQLVIFFLFICHSLSFPLNSSMASHEETYALELIRQHLLADFASMEPQKPSSSLSQRRHSLPMLHGDGRGRGFKYPKRPQRAPKRPPYRHRCTSPVRTPAVPYRPRAKDVSGT
ncbi:hypothetical protein F3Y22_tig00110187pilonHSYRG00235 [Hibiscus syriacus]|uniref:Uncharacterized protein n=1 Tax=Hibiscus syriacus TaxID=106335 RepID=A0A6A3BD41_HIBSY|nr:hypothetical protein F3Y22_tig00110187pilonHSYRG00235 [Hibiscus syriacus]